MPLQRQHYALAALVFGALILVLMFWNRGYGELSPKGYEYAKALYSICNRQDEARLEEIAKMLSEARANGDVSQRESDWLHEAIAVAQSGEWEEANLLARRMLEDQVR
jgi:hypothetical protein